MTNTDLSKTIEPASQSTAVEQARVIAEVQAAVTVAQSRPRSVPVAVASMREACSQPALASRAFFRFPRSGQQITGPTIHLARALAACWGHIDYGIRELRRDDDAGISEMQAYAWDQQGNTRVTAAFIVPHARDTKTGRSKITELRDIYENNANQGARRVRECIFAVLPPWFTEEAQDLCRRTIEHGGGVPLATRVADAVRLFDEIGVVVDRLEQKVGAKSGEWSAYDVTQLGVIYGSIRRGETSADAEFPRRRVTAAEITGGDAAPSAAPSAADPDDFDGPNIPQGGDQS